MNKWLELIVGLVLVVVPILAAFYWIPEESAWYFGDAAVTVLKGGIFWFFVGIGALFILLGISDMKE